MHSFIAYIDEAGDEGFIFKDPPERASSEWFVIGATVIRSADESAAMEQMKGVIAPMEEKRKFPIHFSKLPHEARVAICHGLSKSKVFGIIVAGNKRQLDQPDHALDSDRHLYFYSTRFLIERISWLVRDCRRQGEGNGQCKLVFSHCKNLSYSRLKTYLKHLRTIPTHIEWNAVDVDNIEVLAHGKSVGLRLADSLVSGFYQGLELSQYSFSEGRYARMLKPIMYQHGGKYMSYGLKRHPCLPQEEEDRDGRYIWIREYLES